MGVRKKAIQRVTKWFEAPAHVLDPDGQPSDLKIKVRLATVRDSIWRSNNNSQREITWTPEGQRVVRSRVRDGDTDVATVVRFLAEWTIEEQKGVPTPINSDTVQDSLTLSEFNWAYSVIFEQNGQFFGVTEEVEEAQKN